MKRPAKLRTKIALASAVTALAGTGLFAAAGAANATTPTAPSQSVQVAPSGQGAAGTSAPNGTPALSGLPMGGGAVNGSPVLPNTPGGVQVTTGNPNKAAGTAASSNSPGSLKIARAGQATSDLSGTPATSGLPEGGGAVNGFPVQPNTPGSVQVTAVDAKSAADSAPARSGVGSGS